MLNALLFAAAALAAPAPTAVLDHSTMWRFPRLSAPALSPDGRLAAVVVLQPEYDATQQSADLWLVRTDGSAPPRRLTFNRPAEAQPAFSPDGRLLAFVAQREDDLMPQIYVIDLAGGEAQRVTALSTGARSPQFSPDGKRILFISAVFAEARNDADAQRIATERAARKDQLRVYTQFPVRNWDRWLDDRQQRPFVQPLDGGAAVDLLAGSQIAGGPGYGGRFDFSGEQLDATWCPDSACVVIAATQNRHRSAFEHEQVHLYKVPANGGEARRISPDRAGEWSAPRFAPDGKTLYALYAPQSHAAYAANRLAALRWPDLRALPPIELPQARSVNSYGIGGDSRTLWMTAEDGGREKLFRARAGEATGSEAVDPGAGVYTNLQVAGEVLVANHDSATQPLELVRIDPGKRNHRLLSDFSRSRADALQLSPLEHFEFERDGVTVHNMLVRPAGFDPAKRYPVFVLIHGGPHTMWRDSYSTRWNYHLIAQSGMVLLLTNYSGSTGFGEAFARRIHGDPLKGPADEVNQALDEAIKRFPFIDGERACAGGASYGGHLANWLQGTSTRYRCLVSHAGLVNLESQWGSSDVIYHREVGAGGPVWERGGVWVEQNPMLLAEHFRTPVLVSIGEKDYRVPLNNTLEYWSLLQRQQVESRLLVFPEENHWILQGENSRSFYREMDEWLRRWLQVPAS